MTDYAAAVRGAGAARAAAMTAKRDATERLRVAVVDAVTHGMTEMEAARLGQVNRMTVRKWMGKQ